MRMRMNSPQGKAILALVRGGDYAHPGEEAAIAEVAKTLPQTGIRRLLDVGCGRGGTADWFHRNGWGTVVGVDIDDESLEYARKRYADVDFVHLDVVDLMRLGRDPFDLAYLFNSFYAFPDQARALHAIRAVCRAGAQLLIYDYTQPGTATAQREQLGLEIGRPIVVEQVRGWMTQAGWRLVSTEDWTDRYVASYSYLLQRFESKRAEIVGMAGDDWYEHVTSWYGRLREGLAAGTLGGAALTAVAV